MYLLFQHYTCNKENQILQVTYNMPYEDKHPLPLLPLTGQEQIFKTLELSLFLVTKVLSPKTDTSNTALLDILI